LPAGAHRQSRKPGLGDDLVEHPYRPWKRKVLFLLGALSLVFVFVPPLTSSNPWESGAYVASSVFAVIGVVGVAIALFGSDRQVAKYLGSV
jgi:hypothetical protein